MPVKIRLSRHGKKGYAFYHIVVADSRAPRDGRFIEKLGTYNPNTNPATIDLDFDSALGWLQKGAQPTDTCRAILSYKGVLYKKHLLGGVSKGAFTEDEAAAKFEKWLSEKAARIDTKTGRLGSEKDAAEKARLAAETKIKEERAKAVAAKKAAADAAAAGEEAVEEGAEAAEETAPEAEAAEAPAAESAEEAPAAAPAEEATPAEEAPAEAPAEEEKAAE
ncbi:MAG: 30S ribosomal protein S16 [Rikenellaceae bacterium]|nr:30S ribosomal protein S16 [Rikenellaceae bacterium]